MMKVESEMHASYSLATQNPSVFFVRVGKIVIYKFCQYKGCIMVLFLLCFYTYQTFFGAAPFNIFLLAYAHKIPTDYNVSFCMYEILYIMNI